MGVSILGAAISCFSLFFSIFLGKWLDPSTFATVEAFNHHLISLWSGALSFVGFALFMLVLSCPCLLRRISTVQIEASMILFLTIVMTAVVLSSPPKVCNLQGTDFHETHGPLAYASDSGVLLTIDGTITAVHLGLPVRWCFMFPLEIVGVLLYALIVFWVGSSEPIVGACINLVFLTGLVVASAVGKRVSEIDERRYFRDIIAEKSLRCQAEFELSNVQTRQGLGEEVVELEENSQEGAHQSAAAETMTTGSGLVFNRMHGDNVDLGAKLAEVTEMGRAEHWCLTDSEVKILDQDPVGAGHFGHVVKGIFCNMIVAIKMPNSNISEDAIRMVPCLVNELRIFRYLRHPNIVAFHGATISPSLHNIALVLELVRGVTLKDFLKNGDGEDRAPVGDLVRYQIMIGVCRALYYMHTRRPHLVHGDIKSTNIMVEIFSENLVNPKLLDFGLSRVLTRGARRLGGSAAWAAPELFEKDTQPKCSADIFSFGRLLAFIATGIPPQMRTSRQGTTGRMRSLPKWPSECVFKPPCKPLVQDCLAENEKDRPSITEVISILITVPMELGLIDPHGHFLQDLQLLAAQSDGPAASRSWSFGQPSQRPEACRDMPTVPETANDTPETGLDMPTVREGEPFEAGPPVATKKLVPL